MFTIRVIHEITLSEEMSNNVNRILNLLEINLQQIPKLENDLKESIDLLELAVRSQQKTIEGEKSNG